MRDDQRGIRISPRIIIALLIAGFSVLTYFSSSVYNPITAQKQHLDMTARQEIVLGLQSAPAMAREYGGPSRDGAGTALVKSIGSELVAKSDGWRKYTRTVRLALNSIRATLNIDPLH